jgi:molybdenum cofactor cytidylyltransferase
VLAAGEGSRFGGGKQLALLGGKPLVRWPVEAALASGLAGVLVVIGYNAGQVRRALPRDERVEIIVNPKPDRGMGGSLALAAKRASQLDAAGLVMLLGDMPLVDPITIGRVARAAQKAPAGAAAGSVAGKRSHPVAFDRRHFEELYALGGDKGARDVLARLGDGLALVEVAPESRFDVDTPGDLERAFELLKAAQGRD